MLVALLRGLLAYVMYVRPVMYGARLCKSESPDPKQVTNITLTLIFNWILELADLVFLSSFIASRNLYTVARIVVCLYFAHPRFLGALSVYEKAVAPLIDAYGPMVDSLFMQHMDAIARSGIVHYCTAVSMSFFRIVTEVFDIAKRLMESTADTEVPAAELPRRLSAHHVDPMKDEETDRRPEDQYATPSIVVRVRRTASEMGYHTPSSTGSPPPPFSLQAPHDSPPPPGASDATYVRIDGTASDGEDVGRRVRPSNRHPTAPPSPPPPPQQLWQRQRRQQQNFFESNRDDYSDDTPSDPSQLPPLPPGVFRGNNSGYYAFPDNLYGGNDYGYH